MKRFFAARFSRGVLFLLPVLVFAAPASTRARAADAPETVATQIERGRVLLGLSDARATAVLQNATRISLTVLRLASNVERADDFAPPRESEARVKWRRALRDAIEAHFWLADSQIAAQDNAAAIETLALQLQLANLQNEGAPSSAANRENVAAAQARAKLLSLLPHGAPPHATSATLQKLARFFYRVAAPQSETFSFPKTAPQRVAFLDAPLSPRAKSETASTRSAPLYRAYAKSSLPSSLQMNRAVFAYQADNETHWKLVARVFYASPERTENARDDAPRARFLASRFLKIAALQRTLWDLENPQITNIWLLEKGADWPQKDETSDEDDAQNFRAGGWIESAPSDIFLFRAAVPRSDFGWTRQLMHEYSHAVWPRLGGFTPPLEPFAAGLLGETVMALQLAQSETARVFCDDQTSEFPVENFPDGAVTRDLFSGEATSHVELSKDGAVTKDTTEFLAAARAHVESNALSALRFWNARGARFPTNTSDAESLQWTQGLTVWIERASGGEILSRVLREVKRREYSQEKIAAPMLLLSCYENVLRTQWKEKLRLDFQLFDEDFLREKTSRAKTGARFSRWIYLPPNATSLEIIWRVSPSQNAPPFRLWLDGREAKLQSITKNGGDFASRVALEKRSGGWWKLEMQAANAQFLSATIR